MGITSINGEAIATGERLRQTLRGIDSEGKVLLGILRKGQPIKVSVGVVQYPAVAAQPPVLPDRGTFAPPRLGQLFPGQTNLHSNDHDKRLKSIEERLERIEKMLEALLEEKRKKIQYIDDDPLVAK